MPSIYLSRCAGARHAPPEFSGIRESGCQQAKIHTAFIWQRMRPEFGSGQRGSSRVLPRTRHGRARLPDGRKPIRGLPCRYGIGRAKCTAANVVQPEYASLAKESASIALSSAREGSFLNRSRASLLRRVQSSPTRLRRWSFWTHLSVPGCTNAVARSID
jgi:hypothetical protein